MMRRDVTEYAVRIEWGAGSRNGEIAEIFDTLDEAREYMTGPYAPEGALAIYALTPCDEE